MIAPILDNHQRDTLYGDEGFYSKISSRNILIQYSSNHSIILIICSLDLCLVPGTFQCVLLSLAVLAVGYLLKGIGYCSFFIMNRKVP